jgi:hypothetical protein
VDVPLAFALGVLVALLAGRGLWFERPGVGGRPFGLAFLWIALGFFPVNQAFYFAAPDWQWMYFVRAADVHFAVLAAYDVLFFVAFGLGFVLGHESVRSGHRWIAFVSGGAALGGVGAFLWVYRARLGVVGTVEQFAAGTAPPLGETGLVPWIAGGAALVLGALAWTVRALRRAPPP